MRWNRRSKKQFKKRLVSLGVVVIALLFAKEHKQFQGLLAQVGITSPAYENGYVSKVVDGDTIYIQWEGQEEKVRLIGIDTPESVASTKKDVPAGKIAATYLRELVLGKEVEVEFDERMKDNYDRYLAYIYLEDGTMVNLLLAQEGYARAMFYEPNIRYKREIEEAVQMAMKESKGLWQEYTYEEMFPQ